MATRRHVLFGSGAVAASVVALRTHALFAKTAIGGTAVDFEVPPGACDCHVHVFDPARFPYVAKRVYTPPEASVEDLIALQKALRMDRVVIVQPSVYGADNACTLDAVRRLGARARAVAVIDKATSATELDEMAGIGVRGIRLNLNTTPGGEIDADGSRRTLDVAAEQIRGRNWHIQFYTRPNVIAALKNQIEQLPFPVVFDHFGGSSAKQGPSQPGFDALIDLVRSERAYVKISGSYRISDLGPDFADATPMARALIAANADRVVWGSDWPHPDSSFGRGGRNLAEVAPPFPIDDGLVLNQLPKWTADAVIRQKILVDNAARLYDFPAAESEVVGTIERRAGSGAR
jgi:predicted TIM-barrel fold metal-dependent hydrolase